MRIPYLLPAGAMLASAALLAGCGSRKETEPPPAAIDDAPAVTTAPVSMMPPASEVAPDTPVVTVNGEVLTRADADAMVARMLASQGVPPQSMQQAIAMMGPRMESRIVDQFVATTLLKAEAIKRKLEISEAEADAELAKMAATLPPGQTLESALAMAGLSADDLRRDIRDNESIKRLYEQETADVPKPTEEEIAAHYTDNQDGLRQEAKAHTRHILIEAREGVADEAAMTAAEAKATELRRKLVEDKADFAELAKSESSCPSAKAGGDLGEMEMGPNVDPAFVAAVEAQEIDAIGEVVKSSFGYHIIQVLGRTEAGVPSLESVHDDIDGMLLRQRRGAKFEKLIDELRGAAEIVYPAAAAAVTPPPLMSTLAPPPAE